MARVSTVVVPKLEFDALVAELARLHEEAGSLENATGRMQETIDRLRDDKERLWQKCRERGDELARLREENKQLLLTKAGAFKAQMEYAEENARLREREQELLSVIREVREERDRLREALKAIGGLRDPYLESEEEIAAFARNALKETTWEKPVRETDEDGWVPK